MPALRFSRHLIKTVLVCFFFYISNTSAAEVPEDDIFPPLNTTDNDGFFRERFEKFHARIRSLSKGPKDTLQALHFSKETLPGDQWELIRAERDVVRLEWGSGTSDKVIAEIEVLDTPQEALERLASLCAMSNAPDDIISSQINTSFGDVCLGESDSASVIIVRNNVLARVFRWRDKDKPVAPIVRSLEAAIMASAGIQRHENDSRFIYPQELLIPRPEVATPICYHPFKKSVYALTREVSLLRGKGFKPEHNQPTFLIMDYVASDRKTGVSTYHVTGLNFGFDLDQSPQPSEAYIEIGLRGISALFESRERNDEQEGLILENDATVRRLLFAPIFPRNTDDVTIGSEWSMRIPPVTPSKAYSVLKQKWISSEIIFGFRCAKISYQINDKWVDNERRETANYDLNGVVYFAIQEGVVIMDTAHLDISGVLRGGKFRRTWRRNLLLLHHEPLEEQNEDVLTP